MSGTRWLWNERLRSHLPRCEPRLWRQRSSRYNEQKTIFSLISREKHCSSPFIIFLKYRITQIIGLWHGHGQTVIILSSRLWFQAQMRQDMVKEMKNDFEEDRKKLKQVYLALFWGLLLCYCFLYLILITGWMSLSISFWSFFVRFKLIAIFWLFVYFPGDPARLPGRGWAKGVWGRVEEYLSDTSIYFHKYSLKYLFKGGVEEEREGEGDGSWAAGVWWGWWWNMCC